MDVQIYVSFRKILLFTCEDRTKTCSWQFTVHVWILSLTQPPVTRLITAAQPLFGTIIGTLQIDIITLGFSHMHKRNSDQSYKCNI